MVDKQNKFPFEFFLIVFLWSWLSWLPMVLEAFHIIQLGEDIFDVVRTLSILFGVFGPGMAALISLRIRNGKGSILKYLRSLLDLRFGLAGWIIPIILLGGSNFIAWIIPEVWGELPVAMNTSSLMTFPLTFLFMTVLGGGQEELGWRGYILDPIEKRFGIWWGNLLFGFVWAVWHLPLFYVPGTGQYYLPFVAFIIACIGLSAVLAYLRDISGKKTMAGLYAHGIMNSFLGFFPIWITEKNVAQPRYWVFAILILIIGFVVSIIRTKKLKDEYGKTAPQF